MQISCRSDAKILDVLVEWPIKILLQKSDEIILHWRFVVRVQVIVGKSSFFRATDHYVKLA